MKNLLLIRHAKSSWPLNLPDFDRPLDERGNADAEKMAKFLMINHYNIDCFLSSPSKRTTETLFYFTKQFPSAAIEYIKELYHPQSQTLLDIVLRGDDRFSSIAIVSHNNGISDFASDLVPQYLHFPTCGIADIEIDCQYWSQLEIAPKKLKSFLIPKEI